jgi:hydroxypyruvate isomerase
MKTASAPSARDIRNYCEANAHQHREPHTNEVNFTRLAEACAHAIGYAGWLDEEYSPVWDIALDVAEEADRVFFGGARR